MSYLCTSFGVRTCCKADMYINRRVGCLAVITQDIKRESGASPEQSRCCKFEAMRNAQCTMRNWHSEANKSLSEGNSDGKAPQSKQVRRPANNVCQFGFRGKSIRQ